MNAKEHMSFALYTVAIIVIAQHIDITIDTQFAIGVVAGSILPDIDHRQSIAGYIIPLHLVRGVKHGGITHTIVFNAILLCIGLYYQNQIIIGISSGYATHLYIDNITGNNLKFLYFPFKRRKKNK